jgi:short subunit fatty acids transporter
LGSEPCQRRKLLLLRWKKFVTSTAVRALLRGKWLLEAPHVMQAANDLKVHLGWAVQVNNAAEALPKLINPFWMLPLLGVLGIKARCGW